MQPCDVGAARQCLRGSGPAQNQIDNAIRKTGFKRKLGKAESGERCTLRRLYDDAATGKQGVADGLDNIRKALVPRGHNRDRSKGNMLQCRAIGKLLGGQQGAE
jgi:hypothetical protein